MKSRSRAPLRIGLAGGGTDVSPYCDLYGGEVLNVAITLYAHCSVTDQELFQFSHNDMSSGSFELNDEVPSAHIYELHAGVVNRIQKEFGQFERSLRIESKVDVPLGSGLGTSSTLLVSILGAVLHHRKILLSKKEIAALAYSIEREDLGHAGGRQDQYAACFGGLNSMRFSGGQEVDIIPIKASSSFLSDLENNLLLYYTSHSRYSGQIIEEQILHVKNSDEVPLEAMHYLKKQSQLMRKAFESENYLDIAQLIDLGFREKKKMATEISNERLELIYETAKKAGAVSGKISGAGGGGFMIFCVPAAHMETVRKALLTFGGTEYSFQFDHQGLITWNE